MADTAPPSAFGRRAVSMPLSATRPSFTRGLEIERLSPSQHGDGEELFTHINTRIIALDISRKRQPCSWSQPGERAIAVGILRVEKRNPFGLLILTVGSQVSHTLFKRSRAWEVATGKFCLRIDDRKYWRIEIIENSGGTLKADEFRDLLKAQITFGTRDCPFHVGDRLPEDDDSDVESTVSISSVRAEKIPVRKRVASISLAKEELPSFFKQQTKAPAPQPQLTLPRLRPLTTLHRRSASVAPDFARPVPIESPSPPYVTPDESPQNSYHPEANYLDLPLRNQDTNLSIPKRQKSVGRENRTPSPPLSKRRGRQGLTPLLQPLSPIPQVTSPASPTNSASSHPTTPTLCHTSDFDYSPTTSDSDCDSTIWSPPPRMVSINLEKHSSPRAAQILSRTAGLITATVLKPSATLACFMLSIAGKVARSALEVGTGSFEHVEGGYAGYPGAWEDSIEEDDYVFRDDYGVDLRGKNN